MSRRVNPSLSPIYLLALAGSKQAPMKLRQQRDPLAGARFLSGWPIFRGEAVRLMLNPAKGLMTLMH